MTSKMNLKKETQELENQQCNPGTAAGTDIQSQ